MRRYFSKIPPGPPPKDVGYVFPVDPVKTAGYLIEQAGGVKQARAAITAAAKLSGSRGGGRPRKVNDEFWLRIAANLQHRAKLRAEAGKGLAFWSQVRTKEGAITELASQSFAYNATKEMRTFTRRLLRKLGTRPLSDFVTDYLDVSFIRHTKPPR